MPLKLLKLLVVIALGAPLAHGQQHIADSLRAELRKAKVDSAILKVNLELGSYYSEIIPDSAYYFLDKAEAIAIGKDLKHWQPKVLRMRAIAQVVNGQYDAAKISLKRAMELCGNAPTRFLKGEVAGIYNLTGIIHDYHSNYDSALDCYFKSLEIYKTLNDWPAVLRRYNNVALEYERMGNFTLALKYLYEALSQTKEDIGIIRLLLNISKVHKQMNDVPKSKQALRQALALVESSGIHDTTEPYIYGYLGNLYSIEGKTDSALLFLRNALALNEKSNHKNGIAENHYYLGLHYKSVSNWPRVIEESEKARAVFSEMGTKAGVAQTEQLMAEAYLHMNQFAKALSYAQNSLNISIAIKSKGIQKSGLEILTKIYSAQKLHAKAFEASQALLAVKDSIFNEEKVRQAANMEAIYENDKKEKELALIRIEKQAADANLESQKNKALFLFAAIGLLLLLLLAGGYFYVSLKRKRQLLAAKNEELRLLNQTKDRFFAIVGHDLRGPITSFSGLNDLINWYIEKKEFDKLKTIGAKVTQSVKQLDTLLNNLLNWAMAQTNAVPYRPEPLQLCQLTSECVSFFQHAVESKNLELRDLTRDDLFIYADKNAVATVIRNLISNAIKFTPHAGQVKIAAETKGEFVWISISDTGVGISQEKQKMLFTLSEDKSTRGTSGEKGTGLGLVLCQEYVALNKGALEVLSEIDKGTTFLFSVPSFQPKELTTLSQEVLHG